MIIEANCKIDNVLTFADLSVGDVFSFDDCSGLYIVTGSHEAFDLSYERMESFDNEEKVIRRKIKIVVNDALPIILG